MDTFKLLRINEQNARLRMEFLGLGPDEAKIMREKIPWIEKRAAGIVKKLYDHQMNFPPTRKIFDKNAGEKNISVDALREHLEHTVKDQLIGMFRGSEQQWGAAYLQAWSRVGVTHHYIDLPQKWFIGLSAKLLELTGKALREDFPKGNAAWETHEAMTKVMNLGVQAVCDSFFIATMLDAGFDISSIDPPSAEADVSECVPEIKNMVSSLLQQCALVANNQLDSDTLEHTVPGRLGEAITTTVQNARTLRNGISENAEALNAVSSAVGEMNQAVSEISQSTSAAVSGMQQAEELASNAMQIMDSLRERSREIGNVVKMITSIADQTNLLALNATIEAARSGEAGRGFAVVAGEVKELARQAAEATDQIRHRIETIQSETTDAVSAMNQIGTAIGEVTEASQSIAGAVAEQSAVNDRLAGDMKSAVDRSQQLLGS